MKSLPLICMLAFAAFSCLDPGGTNFVNIPRFDESAVVVDLNNYTTGDTILVDAITTFSYKVMPDHWTSDVAAKLDEQTLFVNYGQFEINPFNFSNGVHRLHFQVKIETESQSLADHVNGELTTVVREFVLIIDNKPPADPNLQIDTLNGTVTLHWTKCEKKNFVSYTITKSCSPSGEDYSPSECLFETIRDKNITSWTDQDYTGRVAQYYFEVNTTALSSTDEVELRWDPKFVTTFKNGHATIHWHKPFFSANIIKVLVQDFEVPVADTSFSLPDKTLFGSTNHFTLDFIPAREYKHDVWSYDYWVGTKYVQPAVMPLFYHPVAKKYYGYSYPVNVVMDENLNTLQSIQSDYVDRSLSPNGSYFITFQNGGFYYTDPATLSTELAYMPSEISVTNFSVSNNGLLGYHSTAGYSVVDLNTGVTIFNVTWPSYEIITCNLSPSGKYLSYGGKMIYENNGSTFVLKEQFDQYSNGFLFLDDDNILVSGDRFLKKYDINNLDNVTTLDLGPQGYIEIVMQDPVSHKVLCHQAGQYFLVNTSTNKTYLVGNGSLLRIFNSTLFSALDPYSFTTIDCSYVEQP